MDSRHLRAGFVKAGSSRRARAFAAAVALFSLVYKLQSLELGIIVLAVTICSCEVGCLSSAPTKVRVAHPSPH